MKKGMKVLVIGGGGREHALAWKIEQSPLVKEVICAPGNAGTEMLPRCRNIDIKANDINGLLQFSKDEGIGLVVVGPEDPLVNGIADLFKKSNIPVFGPSAQGAMMEGSKSFAKKLLMKYRIPTAKYKVFKRASAAKAYVEKHGLTKVIKADGLTGGKGVDVYDTVEKAFETIDRMMIEKIYGKAGETILIEDRLKGKEASFQFFTDGTGHILPLETAEDHKALLDFDKGPNTGGMGVLSPARITTGVKIKMQKISERLVYAMKKEGIDYRGLCYIGFMIVGDEVYVLEINCRFGDPETQPLMMRMESDIIPIMLACTNGTLDKFEIEWDYRPAACVVLASDGYPENPKKGDAISGSWITRSVSEDVFVFHAGTIKKDSAVLTNGGRVLGVTALGVYPADAAKKAYKIVNLIHFKGMQYRKDIPRNLSS